MGGPFVKETVPGAMLLFMKHNQLIGEQDTLLSGSFVALGGRRINSSSTTFTLISTCAASQIHFYGHVSKIFPMQMREYGQLSPLPLRPTLVPPLQLSRQTVASSGLLLEILIKFFIRALLSPSFSAAYLNRATIQRKQGAHEQQYYYYAVICCNRTTFTRCRDTAERASERLQAM